MAIFSAQGLSTAPLRNILDEGLYVVNITKSEAIVSSKGTPGVVFESVVEQGPIQEQTQLSPMGRRFSWTLWIPNEGAGRNIGLQRLAKLCKVMGIDRTDDLDLDQFVGRQVIVQIAHEDYNGEPQERANSFRKVGQE